MGNKCYIFFAIVHFALLKSNWYNVYFFETILVNYYSTSVLISIEKLLERTDDKKAQHSNIVLPCLGNCSNPIGWLNLGLVFGKQNFHTSILTPSRQYKIGIEVILK